MLSTLLRNGTIGPTLNPPEGQCLRDPRLRGGTWPAFTAIALRLEHDVKRERQSEKPFSYVALPFPEASGKGPGDGVGGAANNATASIERNTHDPTHNPAPKRQNQPHPKSLPKVSVYATRSFGA